jgi:NADPH2:quinone reductase
MLAVQVEAYGAPVCVQRVPVPQPARGEVLIQVAAAPVNPTDLAVVRGLRQSAGSLPVVPGAEGSGTVVAAGAGLLPRLWLGRRVACASAPGRTGTWAEYMVTRATFCFPLQGHVSLEQGAMLIVNPLTALAFFDIARRDHHAALVSNAAASALGRMIGRLGRRRGLPVINIVRRAEQASLLRAEGAEWVLNSSDPDFSDQLRALARRLNATLLLDAVAGDHTQVLLAAAPPGSTVLVYAHLAGQAISLDARTLFYEDKRAVGFYLPNWMRRKGLLQILRDTRTVQHLAATDLATSIQRRVPLAEAQRAVDLYVGGMTAGKVLLVADPQAVPLD